MEHQFLHLIITALFEQPKCVLTPIRVTRLGDFSPIGLLLEGHYDMIFWKNEVGQKGADFLGYFLFKHIFT